MDLSKLGLNYESKAKFFTSLGLFLVIIAVVYPFFIFWLFDSASAKYIDTELKLAEKPNLNQETLKNIEVIQNTRFILPTALAKSWVSISLVSFFGGLAFYYLGLFLWKDKE